MNTLEKALTFAKARHEGQFRRDGKTPYFMHCLAVADLVDTTLQKSIALCHDLIEDKRATYEEIKDNVSVEVADGVLELSHYDNEHYEAYIKSLKGQSIIIKIADIVANLTDKPTPNQVTKYTKALRILARRS